ncbi:MAG: metallophosphoesterase family protein, partial [Kiritimatiellae bacterium]|nr:metallophosphoesterase family protein [Kiritimatiellia bacterium]
MRYAIVSDIHGNLQAWNTVLADAAVRGVERILCLGDVVGYGPQPAQTLRSVHSKCAAFTLGNHDAVICGRMPAEAFNDRARRSIEWSKRRLGAAAAAFFADLPLAIVGDDVRCTHGSPADPASFAYVNTADDAAEAFRAVSEQLLFCGHTHTPALFVIGESGVARETEPRDFALESGKRYLVNVGSVGSPRGGDPRASYVIWDDAAKSVYFVRVSFDLDSFRAAVAAAACGVDPLSPGDVPLLASASGATVAQVREETDFSPRSDMRVAPSG